MAAPLVPIRYVRVRLDGRTLYLLLTRDDAHWLSGWEVTREGDRLDRLQLIHRSAIEAGEVVVTTCRMNLTYCRLEVR